MKGQRYSVVFFFALFSFLLFVNLSEGRSGVGVAEEYWKKMMKNEPLPESIKELLNNPFRTKQERFIKNFNTKSVLIIYHNSNVFLEPMEYERAKWMIIKGLKLRIMD